MKINMAAKSIPMIKDVALSIIFSTVVCLFAWAITAAFNPSFVNDLIYSTGDIASNELLVIKAKSFELFSGNYSRMEFYHPGPFFFYVMATGEVVLYDMLALVGSPVASHVFSIVFLNALFSYISFSALKSVTGSASAAALVMALAVASLVAMSGSVEGVSENTWETIDLLSSTWPPYFIVFPSMAVFSLLVSIMAGNAYSIVLLIPSSLVLLHGHASFIFLFPIFTAIAIFLWIKRRGPLTPSIAFDYLLSVRSYIAVGLLLSTPLILPILVESRGNLIGWLSQ
ncbi:hypothetical protein [Skermanella pratensis]|uniref:hypothetical protein n=1 Tax=Skermanella pratensis TaxID=2233999 RepID=UPI0013019013|nr:hypothetical protein [Skermanella pratensis]